MEDIYIPGGWRAQVCTVLGYTVLDVRRMALV